MKIVIKNESELASAAREFLSAIGSARHIAFRAQMGAGKTTFISAICRELGCADEATSPTFSIVNEYEASDRTVFHFDFYRLESPAEVADLGLEEYFESDGLCLMEWPDVAEPFLPDDTVEVTISVDDDGTRVVEIADDAMKNG